MKVCTKCGISKDDFYKGKSECRSCSRERSELGYANNRDERRKAMRSYHLRATYGISLDEFDSLVCEQGGKCAICREETDELCVDHSHQTGVVRGLLCHLCNRGLGNFRDDIERLEAAIGYLEHG